MEVSSSTLSPTGDIIKLVRRVVQAKEDIPAVRTPHRGARRGKPGRLSRPRSERYGVQIPRGVNDAYHLDAENKKLFGATQ